jgi:hypothetical protein
MFAGVTNCGKIARRVIQSAELINYIFDGRAMRRIMSITFAHGREVHDALNKAHHVRERRQDVRQPCPRVKVARRTAASGGTGTHRGLAEKESWN